SHGLVTPLHVGDGADGLSRRCRLDTERAGGCYRHGRVGQVDVTGYRDLDTGVSAVRAAELGSFEQPVRFRFGQPAGTVVTPPRGRAVEVDVGAAAWTDVALRGPVRGDRGHPALALRDRCRRGDQHVSAVGDHMGPVELFDGPAHVALQRSDLAEPVELVV